MSRRAPRRATRRNRSREGAPEPEARDPFTEVTNIPAADRPQIHHLPADGDENTRPQPSTSGAISGPHTSNGTTGTNNGPSGTTGSTNGTSGSANGPSTSGNASGPSTSGNATGPSASGPTIGQASTNPQPPPSA